MCGKSRLAGAERPKPRKSAENGLKWSKNGEKWDHPENSSQIPPIRPDCSRQERGGRKEASAMPEAAWRTWRSLREEFFGRDIRSSWVTAPAYNRISFAFIRVHLRFRAGTSRRNPFFAVWNRFRAVLDPFSAKNDASGAIFGLPSPKSEDFQHGWTRMDARTGKTARSGHF